MSRGAVIGLTILGVLIFVGVLTYLSLGARKNRVEVCMEFQGRTACASASSATPADAVRSATTAACAQIAGGVTDTIACEHASPKSVKP